MREVVPIAADTWNHRNRIHAAQLERDRASRISLQCQDNHVVHQPLLGNGIVAVINVVGNLGLDFGFGPPDPAFGLL